MVKTGKPFINSCYKYVIKCNHKTVGKRNQLLHGFMLRKLIDLFKEIDVNRNRKDTGT